MKIDLNPNRNNYYRQMNNELDPVNSCQVTAMTQCLDILFNHNVTILNKLNQKLKQPEDCLRYYILSDPDIQAFAKKSHPSSNIPAVEWAGVLVYAVNRIYNRQICYFHTPLLFQRAIQEITNGLPFMTSMKYAKIPGHYVSVVGMEADRFIIDDPYKNDLTCGPDGYHNSYTFKDWEEHNKGYGIFFNPVKG